MKYARFAVLLVLLGCLCSSPAFASDEAAPCPSELQKVLTAASANDPNYQKIREAWDECEDRAETAKKADFARTADAWAAGLDRLPGGGWVLLEVRPDGTSAVFGSRRHEIRKGSVVAVWLRTEYRETQANNGISYKSLVERDMYDCERIANKEVSVAYYGENNLNAPAGSFTFDEEKSTWNPIIPGTVGDSLLDWACRASKAQPAKSH